MGKLEELDYDYTVHEDRYKQDHRLMVRFYKDVVPDDEASKAAGFRKFRDTTFIQIVVPGDRRQITVREARPEDKHRFREKYERFVANEANEIDGYPLSQWASMTRAQVEELKYFHIHTVENLANAGEQVMARHPGLRELQRRAAAFLEQQKGNAPVEKLQSQIDTLARQNEVLQAQLAEFMKNAGRTPQTAAAAAKIASSPDQHDDPKDLGEGDNANA